MVLITVIITIIITIVEVIVIAITKINVTKEKKKEKKNVIRTGEWNNMTSLLVIPSLYANVIVLINNYNLVLKHV